MICVTDPEAAAARDAAMIASAREKGSTPALPTPAIGPGLLLEGDRLAGHLFVQGEVRRGDQTGRFDDVVGSGFALVSSAADPASALGDELGAFFASIGGVTARVASAGPVRDLNGTYERWFAERAVAVALQRPDFHVFGTAPTVNGAAPLVSQLRDALRGR